MGRAMLYQKSMSRLQKMESNFCSLVVFMGRFYGTPNGGRKGKSGRNRPLSAPALYGWDYFAVLIKLRLSHRYLMPDRAVTRATSQQRTMLMVPTASGSLGPERAAAK